MTRLLLIFILGISANAFAEYGQCPTAHCGAKSAIIKKVCDSKKLAVAFLEYNNDFCWCACSCVTADTTVLVPLNKTKAMGGFKISDKVLALKNKNWVESTVTYSGAGGPEPERPYPYAVFIEVETGNSLITTADHAFLLSDGTLKRADRLIHSDILLSSAQKPLKITKLAVGEYLGRLANITTDAPKNGSYEGHIISTNGILSGDFYAQNNLVPQTYIDKPQIGSSTYLKVYGKNKVTDESIFRGQLENGKIDLGEGRYFAPYKSFNVPEKAVPFLPPEHETPIESLLYPLDSSVPYEIAEYIVWQYKRFYPEINFEIHWTDDRVNAYAWMSGGKRYVALLGGLVRHKYIQKEGVGLVLAHEMGHHYGGEPKYPNNPWASCEGQSDYWGALVAERVVWWGPEALRQIKEGGQQLYNLFSGGLLTGNLLALPAKENLACSHPPAYCRLQTYQAAARMDDKPSCAAVSE